MPPNKTIFFSWQSDLPEDTNHYAIKDCIKKATKGTNLSYDEATRGTSGCVNILDKILEKIPIADIFVCDITTVGRIPKSKYCPNSKSRPTPNPNVLLELGYAIANLGLERIILVYNQKYANKRISAYSDLPFDIPKHRIIGYKVDNKNDKDGKNGLTGALKNAIEAILKNNPVKNADIIRSHHEGKRTKDVENLKWFLKRVSLKAFDIFRDNLPMKVYMPIVDFFEPDITFCYNNSLFHIHNQELRVLVDDFCHSLNAVCHLGGRLHHPGRAIQTDEYKNGTGFFLIHGSGDTYEQFEKECSKFEATYKRLRFYIRGFYTLKEVDVDTLSIEAHNAFVDFLHERKANTARLLE